MAPTSEPLSDEREREIGEHFDQSQGYLARYERGWADTYRQDVSDLLAEVRRLRERELARDMDAMEASEWE